MSNRQTWIFASEILPGIWKRNFSTPSTEKLELYLFLNTGHWITYWSAIARYGYLQPLLKTKVCPHLPLIFQS